MDDIGTCLTPVPACKSIASPNQWLHNMAVMLPTIVSILAGNGLVLTWSSVAILLLCYVVLVRSLRYRRRDTIRSSFRRGARPLSSMTTNEAYAIMSDLQELEFPYSFGKARTISLLKVSGTSTTLEALSHCG